MATIKGRIPIENFDSLQDEIIRLNKRASKLGLAPLVFSVLDTETVEVKDELGFTYNRVYKIVEVVGEPPVLEGWTLIAAVTPQKNGENLIRAVPGEQIPAKYRNVTTSCDHCQAKRYRKDIFLLRHGREGVKKIGRSCLQDFLGGVSPESLISQAENYFNVVNIMGDAEGEGFGGGRGRPILSIERFLCVVAICIRRTGWVSRGKAMGNMDVRSTADLAWDVCMGHGREIEELIKDLKLFAEDRDEELAKKALEWAKSLPTQGVADYIYNLGVACRQETVSRHSIGIAASAIAAYQRDTDQKREMKEKNVGVHLGTIGERLEFRKLKVESMRSYEGDYGVKTLVTFKDKDGNTLKWWAAANVDWLEEGDTVTIVGTIKKHDIYKGYPQTVLSRVRKGSK